MSVTIIQVDAFTGEPFGGNPAAVCVLPRPADPAWMQRVAREMNLSETAFLVGRASGGYDLRWFTPAVEVDLCGHATLAAAHVLWEDGHLPPPAPAEFHTRSGKLSAVRRDGWIEMDFPAEPAEPAPAPDGLADALGAEPVFVGRNRFDYLVEVDSEAAVRALAPDIRRLGALPARGVIVTARGGAAAAPAAQGRGAAGGGGMATARGGTGRFDFVSRFFAPRAGVDEDPVTGSAHCCLGPYWRGRLGRDAFTAWQASARGGVVKVVVAGDRVLLSGQAVTVLRGELLA